MQLLDSLKRSLEFFERKNLSIFCLVTLKAIKTTYGQIGRYLLLPLIVGLVLGGAIKHGPTLQVVVVGLLMGLFLLAVCLAVRSSVLKKDWRYYLSYWKHGLYIVPLLLFAQFLMVFMPSSLIFVGTVHYYAMRAASLIIFMVSIILIVFIVFTALFFLDSRVSFNSFLWSYLRSARMILHNFSVCFIVASFLSIIWVGLAQLGIKLYGGNSIVHHMDFLGTGAMDLQFMIIWLVATCLLFAPVFMTTFANLYIKWLHEQFDLYFDQPK